MKKLARIATTAFIVVVCGLAATVYTSNLPVAAAPDLSTTHRVKQCGDLDRVSRQLARSPICRSAEVLVEERHADAPRRRWPTPRRSSRSRRA